MKFASLLVFALAVAVGATETTKPDLSAQPPVRLAQPLKTPSGVSVYALDGSKVAECSTADDEMKFSGCKLEKGYTLDDLMNNWVQAYLTAKK